MSFGTETARARHNAERSALRAETDPGHALTMDLYKLAEFKDSTLEALMEASARVLKLHGECGNRCGVCHECGQQIPCGTARAFRGDPR